jgi:YVTN family beta-propeller protein
MKALARVALWMGLAGLSAAAVSAQVPYKVLDRWKIGGTGGWDYLTVDPSTELLYLTHGQRVEVVDTKTGKAVGAITGLKGTHGVVFDPGGKIGFISDGAANAVVVFDRKTFAVLGSIPAGTNPDGMVYEPVTATVWAFNGRSKDVTVIDAASQKVVATIPLPGKPEFPTVDGQGNVYDNIETTSQIVKLDAKTRTLTATWPLTGCEGPSGMAIDTSRGFLFSVCDGHAAVVDYATGKQIALATIGDGPDAANVSVDKHVAFASNGAGTLSVVDTAHQFRTIETLPTQKGARTMWYDPATDRAYLVAAQYGPAPAATAAVPHPRPVVLPDSFTVIVVGR